MKQMAYPGSLYDFKGVEAWLERLSATGWRLEEFTKLGNLAKLQECPPLRRKYYLEPDFKQYKAEEAKTMYAEQGWTFVCEVPGFFLIYESEDLWTSKPKSWKADEKQLQKKWRKLWSDLIFWIAGLGIAGWQFFKTVDSFNFGYYEWLLCIFLISIPSIALILMDLWAGVTKTYDLYIWRKCIRFGENTEHWNGMKVFRWGEYVMLPMILTVVLVTIVFGVNGSITSRSYTPISRQNRELPMVTLDVTDAEIHYAPEPYGPSIDVSFKRRLLIPQDIHINSIGLYENQGDLDAWVQRDHTSDPDAEMRFAYYRLWTDHMAAKLANKDAEERNAIKAEDTYFDEIWLWNHQWADDSPVWQRLIAREGDVVITVDYLGKNSLEMQLEEIYRITTEYRNR